MMKPISKVTFNSKNDVIDYINRNLLPPSRSNFYKLTDEINKMKNDPNATSTILNFGRTDIENLPTDLLDRVYKNKVRDTIIYGLIIVGTLIVGLIIGSAGGGKKEYYYVDEDSRLTIENLDPNDEIIIRNI